MKSRRASTTVVFVGADRLLRVDLDARGDALVTGRVDRATSSTMSLADGVRASIQVEPSPAARVIVVAESIWTQTVEVPRAPLRGLSTAETARALAFEVEPLSGIGATDAAPAFAFVGSPDSDREVAWVSVIASSERSAIEDALRERDARLDAIVHPAGLVRADESARVEVWDRATWCYDASSPQRMLVLPARAGQRSWDAGLSEWISSRNVGPIRWSGRSRPSVLTKGADARVVDDGVGPQDGDWVRWLTAVASAMQRADAQAPVVHATPRQRRTIGAGVLCLLLCALTLAFVIWRQRDNEVRAAELEDRASVADRMNGSAKEAEAALAAATKQVETLRARSAAAGSKADAIAREWSTQSKRLVALISELSLRKPAGITLMSTEPDERGGIDVRGIGLDPRAIQAFAADLEPGLAAAGWKPKPAGSTEKRGRDGRPYFEFTIGVDQPSSIKSGARAASSATAQPADARRRRD